MTIRWDNIGGLGDPSRLMELGQVGVNKMFTGFENLIKGREATQTANWDQGKVNNTADFLAAVRKPQNATEYEAAMKSGLLDQLRQSYGAQVDQTAAANAMDGRLSVLRGRDEQSIKYNQVLRTEEQRPLSNQLASMIAAGDTVGARLVLAAHPELDQAAKLSTDASAFDRRLIEQGQHDTANALATATATQNLAYLPKKQESDLRTAAAQQASAYASANHSNASTILAQGQEADRQKVAASLSRNAAAQAMLKGTVYEGGVWTGKDVVEGRDILSKIDSTGFGSGEANKMMERLSQIESEGGLLVKGQRVPLPKDLVKGILAGANDQGWDGWNQGGVTYLDNALKKAMEATISGGVTVDGVPIPDRYPLIDGALVLNNAYKVSIEDPVAQKGGSGSPKPPGAYKSPKPTTKPK